MLQDLLFFVIGFAAACVIVLKASYANGANDGYGFSREPWNPGYRRAGEILQGMRYRWPEMPPVGDMSNGETLNVKPVPDLPKSPAPPAQSRTIQRIDVTTPKPLAKPLAKRSTNVPPGKRP